MDGLSKLVLQTMPKNTQIVEHKDANRNKKLERSSRLADTQFPLIPIIVVVLRRE